MVGERVRVLLSTLSNLNGTVAVALGLIGGAVVSTGTPWPGYVLALVLLGLTALWHLLGYHDAPKLTVRIEAARVSEEEQAWLEWPHLAVTNIGQRRAQLTATALNCRASVRVDGGRRYRLRWDSEKRGGDVEKNLIGPQDGNYAETIPFLIRHTRPFSVGSAVTIGPPVQRLGNLIPWYVPINVRFGRHGGFSLFGRFELEGGATYVCDDELLTQTSVHGGGTRLMPGRHVLDVTVTYDRTGRTSQRFVVDVPALKSRDRLKWHVARPRRSVAIYRRRSG